MLKASVSYDPTEMIIIAFLLKYNFYSNLCACHISNFKTLSIDDLVIHSTLYFQSTHYMLQHGNRDLIPFRPSACSRRSNSSQWHLMGFMFCAGKSSSFTPDFSPKGVCLSEEIAWLYPGLCAPASNECSWNNQTCSFEEGVHIRLPSTA